MVDDASHDPTLVLPEGHGARCHDPGFRRSGGGLPTRIGWNTWRSQLDVVNIAETQRSVTIEYNREDGSSVASMAMTIEPGKSLHFDDVVGGLFGEQGKGWLNVMANGSGVVSTSRTYNDDASGTYGQLIPAFPHLEAAGSESTVVLAGLSSTGGFRTNIGITSLGAHSDPSAGSISSPTTALRIGMKVIEIPSADSPRSNGCSATSSDYIGEAWAEISCSDPSSFFAHASVVDENHR